MKTKQQIDEFTGGVPIGMIIEVPQSFDKPGFLEFNGQYVHKDDYPKLASIWKGTLFDQGNYLVLVEAEYLKRNFAMVGAAFNIGLTDGNKLVVKAA